MVTASFDGCPVIIKDKNKLLNYPSIKNMFKVSCAAAKNILTFYHVSIDFIQSYLFNENISYMQYIKLHGNFLEKTVWTN